jgi:hypothetical protein
MEIYRDVVDYEGIYQVSNLGNVKSFKFDKVKQMKLSLNCGYLKVKLTHNKISKYKQVHQLVAESFLNHKVCGMKLVVNHIDFNKTNNSVDNLEIITNRENCNKKHLKSTSKYTGVSWHKRDNKWRAYIMINSKLKHLGYFKTEIEASEAYQKELINEII